MEAIAGGPGVVRLAFGTIDFMLDMGLPNGGPALDIFRARIALASRVAGIAPPIDGVTTSFEDEGLVAQDARHALLLGFGAKLLIHPRQVAPAHRAMRPSPDELDWAREVLDLAARHPEGAAALRGTMVDRPVVERARRLLARR